MGIELVASPVIWSHDTYDKTQTINHFTTVACKYILISNICTSLGQTKYIHYRVCVCFFFFGSNLLCSRDTPYVTHQDCRLVKRGEHPRQALIKPDHNYESRVSPPSPPLSGGSSRGQAIPACFGRAP